MLSKTAWILRLSGLVLLASGCSSDEGGASGAFYVETCSLGCSNGLGGNQVTCGVVNAAENQDLALLFTAPVDLDSVTKQSFQIFDVNTAAVPAGSFLIDPLNRNRLIFRPKLSFDVDGNPVFGFKKDASYKIFLGGTAQGDTGPFVKSTGGRENQARVLCTITTSGIVDPIPGDPTVKITAQEEDPITGELTPVELVQGLIPGAVNIASDSPITFLFDELMNIGTLLVPSTGQSPFIRISLDTDGDLNTVVDRSLIEGRYSFSVNVIAQTTTLLFEPDKGFPSAGLKPDQPRLVVIDVPAAVTDIAGNGLANAGLYNFAPVVIPYPPRTLPDGGEDFSSEANRDPRRTGADWGSAVNNRLTPGEGAGSGRLGDLIVQGGQTRILSTGPARASGTAKFLATPVDGDAIQVAGVIFTFKTTATQPTQVKIQATLPYTVSTLVDKLDAYAAANPGSGVAACEFEQASFNTLLILAKDPGPAGNALTLGASPPGLAELSGATLSGGKLAEAFSSPRALTNFDFDAQPGVVPPPLQVADGVFEFSYVDVEPDAAIVLSGDNPARLLVRGDMRLQSGATIDVAGESRGFHGSITPYGQLGGQPGPGAGQGGDGADRDNTTNIDLVSAGGVAVADSDIDGGDAEGVGGEDDPGTPLGRGRGGVHWPDVFPESGTAYNDVAVDTLGCSSHQVGGAGSGGAYATDGVRGVARTDIAEGELDGGAKVCNLPPGLPPPCPGAYITTGGASTDVGLEPPSAAPTAERLLTPVLGYLRGGAGGGGGGTHLTGTLTFGFTSCFGLGFTNYIDNSAAGGGGGGGAVQIQVGDQAVLAGAIDASGGSGGSAGVDPANGLTSSPGGGGAGGAILIEAGSLDLAASADRMLVAGGSGGTGVTGSLGGGGGTGLVRVEQRGGGLDAQQVALSVNPTDPGDPTSQRWLSVGAWSYDPAATGSAEGCSSAQSCWLVAPDESFSLTFVEDPPAPAAPAEMAWNLDVVLDLGNPGDPQAYPFRGTDGQGPYGGLYPEEHWGQLLDRELLPGEEPAPVVVRFQAAKRTAPIPDLCNVDPTSPLSGVQTGSLTPWVPAPKDLNFFYPLGDMVRWTIVFDRKAPFADQVLGVTNLRIEVVPE